MKFGKKGFFGYTLDDVRLIAVSVCGTALTAASTVYAGLRLGSYLYPALFACVLSAILAAMLYKSRSRTKAHLLQSAMLSGSVAAAVTAAVLPSLLTEHLAKTAVEATYRLSPTITASDSYFTAKKLYIDSLPDSSGKISEGMELSAVTAPIILILFSVTVFAMTVAWLHRKDYVNRSDMNFPEAQASARILSLGDADAGKNGRFTKQLLVWFTASTAFTAARELISRIPFELSLPKLKDKFNISIGFALSPMIAGFGYLAGFVRATTMLIGAAITYGAVIPLLIEFKAVEDFAGADGIRLKIGTGLLIGLGIGAVLDSILERIAERENEPKDSGFAGKVKPFMKNAVSVFVKIGLFIAAYLLLCIAGLPMIVSVIAVILAFFGCHSVMVLSGRNGIFTAWAGAAAASVLVIAVKTAFDLSFSQMFLAVFFISAAGAFAGELMMSYKTGSILGTDPSKQTVMHAVGAVVGIVVTVICFSVIMKTSGAQNVAVSEQVRYTLENAGASPIVWLSATVSCVMMLMKLPAVSLTMSVFLPFSYSACFFVGGLARLIADRKGEKSDFGAAAGLVAGESTAMVLVAVGSMILGV